MALERQADLHDAPAQQDETDSADQTEDEGGQIVHHAQGIAGSERGHRSPQDHSGAQDRDSIAAKALLDLAGDGELLRIVVLFHFVLPPVS